MIVIFKILMYLKVIILELFNMEILILVLIFFDKIEVYQLLYMCIIRILKVCDVKNILFLFLKVLVFVVVWNVVNINYSNVFFNIVDKKICI